MVATKADMIRLNVIVKGDFRRSISSWKMQSCEIALLFSHRLTGCFENKLEVSLHLIENVSNVCKVMRMNVFLLAVCSFLDLLQLMWFNYNPVSITDASEVLLFLCCDQVQLK